MEPRSEALQYGLSLDEPIEAACSLLLRHHVSGLPVVDRSGQLVGVITENDILQLLLQPEEQAYRVADYMTPYIESVDVDDCLIHVAEMFMNLHVRRFPVLRDGRLVGILARRDLVRYFHDLRRRAEISEELANGDVVATRE